MVGIFAVDPAGQGIHDFLLFPILPDPGPGRRANLDQDGLAAPAGIMPQEIFKGPHSIRYPLGIIEAVHAKYHLAIEILKIDDLPSPPISAAGPPRVVKPG